MRRLFVENTPAAKMFQGRAWLFLGVANADSLLFDAEWQKIHKAHPERFRLSYALSQEEKNSSGGDMYVQDRMVEHAEEIFDRIHIGGAHIYFCGLKGMMPGVMGVLEKECTRRGLVWVDILKYWKEAHRWHVEVY